MPEKTMTPDTSEDPDSATRVVHNEAAWLAGRWRHVQGSVTEAGYGLRIEGMDPLLVTPGKHGVTIRRLAFRTTPEPGLLEEAVLGPALLLALALRGTFALHASAIELDGRAYAFLGMSGVGKSTLVRPPHELGRRIADDIVPVSWDDGSGAWAWPRYPQLKVGRLGSNDRPLAERLPLGGLFLLDGHAPASREVADTVVPALHATIAVARHTVASRLFGPALLRRHLAFAAALTSQVPVVRLRYARRHDALPGVRRFVAMRARTFTRDRSTSAPITNSSDASIALQVG